MISRQMCGVHWRIDGQEGLTLGETVAVRILQQVKTRVNDNQALFFLTRSDHTSVWTVFPRFPEP